MLNKIIRFFLENKLVAVLLLVLFASWGVVTAPFNWKNNYLPTDPVPVDAIPDIGENQQIVFTQWMGRSPQDIEDQITYPLTTALLGIPGVKTIRSSSVFGFSSIYIIFEDNIDFYWGRSRILEKLNSLQAGLLPDGVQPALGPDATALGQIYWYTLEGRDPDGKVTGGWDLQELRTIQDFQVKYALASSGGVSEVASIGGYVREYQIDIDPNAMKVNGISLQQIVQAVKDNNRDVGAKTIEINKAEYLVRGIGYIKGLEDLENAVVTERNNTPILLKDVAVVSFGPATRRGALDKEGAEVVGGVVIARYGANPLKVINNVKATIAKIAPGLPKKILADGTHSQVTIVPFYDRTNLIHETLGTLEEALSLEILITILVIIIMVVNLRASILISGLLPLAVLMCFIAMRYLGVDANIVALSGIAIAIGTMVDVGVILSENMLRHLDMAKPDESKLEVIYRATSEVATAVVTAVMTTIVSFLPVFTMQAAEGKLFRPLAFTKTFALVSALIVALTLIPPFAHWMFGFKVKRKNLSYAWNGLLIIGGVIIAFTVTTWAGVALTAFGIASLLSEYMKGKGLLWKYLNIIVAALFVTFVLSRYWLPLGVERSLFVNFLFVALVVGLLMGLFALFQHVYTRILGWCLRHKLLFLSLPVFLLIFGITTWQGFNKTFGFVAKGFDAVGTNIRTTSVWSGLSASFPGAGEEFMPPLDEGSFLLMPSSMPHAGMEANLKVLKQLDMAVSTIPEVDMVVGKLGRAETALDPAPISMYENIINYKPEYKVDEDGHRIRFKVEKDGSFAIDSTGALIPDKNGQYFRNWRPQIHSPDDIWDEIVKATSLPGVTSAPKLQPIKTRLVMLQTGMRAPMGIKIKGPDLKTIEEFGLKLETALKQVPSIKSESVFADRIVGKPYLLININRKEIARYGLSIDQVQHYIEVAIGGIKLSTSVEGRDRFPIRVRYPRELREDPESLKEILIPTSSGAQIPLGALATIDYQQGPQVIKSENTFLVGYVLFDKKEDEKVDGRLVSYAEGDVVNDAQEHIQKLIQSGTLIVPDGVSFEFTGDYENQVRAEKRLSIVVPLVLVIIFLILYFQFRSIATSLMVFTGIFVAFSGGFLMIWLYGQSWFMDLSIFGTNMRDLFQMSTVKLSTAVWVGFIALFGIATDDGVLMATYLKQMFAANKPTDKQGIRQAVLDGAHKRVRPALMTSATTLLALLPVLTSTGRGSDIMIPMAIPSFGGMAVALITLFVVPVLYSGWQEFQLKFRKDA